MTMRSSGFTRGTRLASCALALTLGLAGCIGGVAENRTSYSVHQPVVHKVDMSIDLRTQTDGLAFGEQKRLADWFEAMGIKYGDHIYVDDPGANPSVRSAVEAVAQRYGAVIDEAAPVTAGYIQANTARVIITRYRAEVPGCPEWKDNSDFNPNNATSSNYGCAVNANLAAMVANPEDLVRGQTNRGATTVMSSSKAIDSYRKAEPTGNGGSKVMSSESTTGK